MLVTGWKNGKFVARRAVAIEVRVGRKNVASVFVIPNLEFSTPSPPFPTEMSLKECWSVARPGSDRERRCRHSGSTMFCGARGTLEKQGTWSLDGRRFTALRDQDQDKDQTGAEEGKVARFRNCGDGELRSCEQILIGRAGAAKDVKEIAGVQASRSSWRDAERK